MLVTHTGTAQQKTGKATGPDGQHFLARPSGIAFSDDTYFATSQEEDRVTQSTTPDTFMGPTLWSSDLHIFDAGFNGHIDMLHNSPDAMGIAWEKANAFWVFDGLHASLTRFDFRKPHRPGGSDHSDGIVKRYVEGKVKRVPNVPSHMEMDRKKGLLYVADTGHDRIAVLDTKTGKPGGAILPNYDGDQQTRINGAKLTTLISSKAGLKRPSGLALHDGVLYVGDNATGTIHAFSPESGAELDSLPTGVAKGGLMGLAFDAQDRLYAIDQAKPQVLRFSAKKR